MLGRSFDIRTNKTAGSRDPAVLLSASIRVTAKHHYKLTLGQPLLLITALGARMLFSKDAIQASIRNEDLEAAQKDKEALAAEALTIAEQGFGQLSLRAIKVRGNIAYRVQSIPHSLILRRLNFALRTATGTRPADRDTVIRSLRTVLSEGVNHRVYKFDIKSFFESIDTESLKKEISLDRRIPRRASALLSSYFDRLKTLNVQGIPRGVPLSATLAEYAMQEFDRFISVIPEVYYFARYVDDIVIITSAREDRDIFTRRIKRNLPFSLSFNEAKTDGFDIGVQKKSNGLKIIGSFNYLGYNIAAYESTKNNNAMTRNVSLSIAPNKVRRIKSRLCCAFVQFKADKDFHLLTRRLQVLTGNYNMRDFDTGRERNIGLFCNYRRVNRTEDLTQLDSFLRSIVHGNKTAIAHRLSNHFTKQQKNALLAFSFSKSFANKTFYNFPPNELTKLTGCWRNV